MAIFGSAIGTVGAVTAAAGSSLPAVISVPGLASSSVAITGVGFAQDANVQFMHTLRRQIYIYAFGERMGNIQVNGVAFYNPCAGGVGSLAAILGFYRANSVSNRSSPVSITMGGASLSGFVKGVRTTFSDPGRGVVGFTIIMASMPEMWS